MASNLRVDSIVPATGSSVSIGTATGGVSIPGVLTYEDVTNVDSIGVITARSGIRIGATGANTLITGNGTGIGIGITTPTEELHIRAATPVIRLEDGDNARQSQIVGSDGNLRLDADNNNAIADTNIAFRTDGSERLRIDSNGNTLVNVNTATAGSYTYKLLTSDNISSSEQTFGIQYPAVVTYGLNAESNADFTIKKDGVERLRINTHGLVTAISQYHLHAQRSNNQTGYDAGGSFGTPMIFNQIVSENKASSLSSCFNTSNGLFTAPVTGLYLFNASVYGASGNIFSQSWFTLNGGRASATDWVINTGSTNFSFVQNTQVIRLAAGNTVGFKPYAAGQNNVTINANANHTYFKVTLIG